MLAIQIFLERKPGTEAVSESVHKTCRNTREPWRIISQHEMSEEETTAFVIEKQVYGLASRTPGCRVLKSMLQWLVCNIWSLNMISETEFSTISSAVFKVGFPLYLALPWRQQEGSQQLQPNILTAPQQKKESFSFLTISNKNPNCTTWGDGPYRWASPAHVLTPRSQIDADWEWGKKGLVPKRGKQMLSK